MSSRAAGCRVRREGLIPVAEENWEQGAPAEESAPVLQAVVALEVGMPQTAPRGFPHSPLSLGIGGCLTTSSLTNLLFAKCAQGSGGLNCSLLAAEWGCWHRFCAHSGHLARLWVYCWAHALPLHSLLCSTIFLFLRVWPCLGSCKCGCQWPARKGPKQASGPNETRLQACHAGAVSCPALAPVSGFHGNLCLGMRG